MDISGEYRIPAPRDRVWAALNDPEILKQCIPGCESLEKVSDTEMNGRVRAKVGPVSAKFAGTVTLSDMNPPESYRISGEGKGGAAGFAKGGATVRLEEAGTDTILRYNADAQVGGKLAQIGSRLVKGTADKMANDFFSKFAEVVGGAGARAEPAPEAAQPAAEQLQAAPEAPPAAAAAPSAAPETQGGGLGTWVWVVAILAIVAAAVFVFTG